MLKGTILYKDEDLGEISIEAYARDFGSLMLYLEYTGESWSNKDNMLRLFDTTYAKDGTKGLSETLGDSWRKLTISQSGKYQTNLQNMLFSSRVASLIAYAFETGVRKGKTSSLLELYTEKQYSSVFNFEVKSDKGENWGSFSREVGMLVDLHLQNQYVKIDLVHSDESSMERQLFSKLVQKDKFNNVVSLTPIRNIGIKYTQATLGCEYIPTNKKKSDASNTYGMYKTIEEVIDAHPEKSFTWIEDRAYEIVTDETLPAVMALYNNHDGVIAIDTETSGLGITFLSRENRGDYLVGICMSLREGMGHFFPLQMKYMPNLCGGQHQYFMLKYMKEFCETKKFVTHNLAFDWKVFYIYGINLNAVFDTMLAFGVTLRYKETNFEYGLKDLAHNLFGLDMIELSDISKSGKWGGNEFNFSDLPYDLVKRYAPTDADMTLSVYNYIKNNRILQEFDAEEVFRIELKYAKVIAYSEFFGYHIDIDRLPNMIKEIEEGKERTMQKLYTLAGTSDFNVDSPKQLSAIIYDVLECPDVSGNRSTKKDVLKEIGDITDEDDKPVYPFVWTLLEYRKYESVYKNFLKRRDEFLSEDGFIFPKVFSFGTNTGRCSVKEPNYQSYNDAVKKYTCPRKGFKMWDSDFSQIEYRVLCSMAHETKLIEAFSDPDMDYHTYQAARMFGVPYGAVTKALRQQSKGINFGLPYGMGDSSLGARVFGKRTKENTIKAAKLRDLYFTGQDNIRKFFDTVRDEGVRNGYTRTLFGRRRYYHKGQFSEAQIRRQAGNHVIQGSAADIYKLACVRVFEMLERKGWLGLVLFCGFIHDEILGEVHESINYYEFVEEWRKAFEVPIEGFCKLYAGLGIGNSWYEAKKADWTPYFIDEIVASENRNVWDEDGDKFIAWAKKAFDDHEIRRVTDYIKHNIENKGTMSEPEKIIKPVIDSLLKVKVENYVKASEDNLKALQEYMGFDLWTDTKEGKKLLDKKGLQVWLKAFCFIFSLDYAATEIKAADEVVVSAPVEDKTVPVVNLKALEEEDFIVTSLKTFGFYMDYYSSKLYLNMNMLTVTETAIPFLKAYGKSSGSYRVVGATFNEDNDPSFVETATFVTSVSLMPMQDFLRQVNAKYISCTRE